MFFSTLERQDVPPTTRHAVWAGLAPKKPRAPMQAIHGVRIETPRRIALMQLHLAFLLASCAVVTIRIHLDAGAGKESCCWFTHVYLSHGH